MAKTAIDDLAVVVSASTEQLAGDLRRAASMVERFANDIQRNQPDIIGAKASSIDFGSIAKAARAAGSRTANEFGKSFKSVKEAISLPTKAMVAGGSGAALADPFILATAAADGLAAAVEVPFKLVAAGAHMAAAIIPIPFQLAGAAVEGLTGLVGGLVPVVGGVLSGAGKMAGTVVGGIGRVLGRVASGVGSTIGVIGSAAGQLVGGTMKVAIQGLAVSFSALKESVNLAAEVEQTKISFDVLVGSATKATEVLAGLRKFAAETPFSQKDVTGAGKELAGYGIAADQLVPSIKMLGDVSSATGKPLTELVYLYGTLINQDRAYLVDIKQFATAGIPIFSELAKVLGVTEDRTREMVEAGRVGIPEVQKAFVNMTSAGGRFHGLMAKQATSFGGLREQLSDAWEIAKTKLGAAVIEELGLKDAAKDMTTFVNNLHGKIEEIRPAIRFMGELGRSVANAGMEIGKAAVQLASINFEGIGRSFPETFASVKQMIEDLGNIKVDPKNVSKLGFDMARGIITGLSSVMDWMDTSGREYYDKFRENFIDPVREMTVSIKDALDMMNRLAGAVVGRANLLRSGADAIQGVQAEKEQKRESDWFIGGGWRSKEHRDSIASSGNKARMLVTFGPAVNEAIRSPETFGPRQSGETAASFTNRYRDLESAIDMAANLVNQGSDQYKPKLDQLLDIRLRNFIVPFHEGGKVDPMTILGKLGRGEVPGEVGRPPTRTEFVKDRLQKSLGVLDQLEAASNSRIEANKAADDAAKMAAAVTKHLRDSFFGLVGSALDAKAALSQVADSGIVTKWSPGAEVMDTAKKAREEYGVDPLEKIGKEFAALQKAAALGVINTMGIMQLPGAIDAGTYKRATVGLTERAESLVGPSRLPDAMMRDTTESVRLLNQWQNGNGQKDAVSVLEQIRDLLKAQNAPNGPMGAEQIAKTISEFLPVVLPLGAS